MRTRIGMHSVRTIVVISIFALLLGASAVLAEPFISRQLSHTPDMEEWTPQIDGNYVTWVGWPNNWIDYPDIFLYDISTGETKNITNDPNASDNEVEIDGDNLIWRKDNGWHLYEIPTGEVTPIPASGSFVNINGEHIVWSDRAGSVLLYKIQTGTTTQITDNNRINRTPDIDGNDLVWVSYPPGDYSNKSVHHYDISTGQSTTITANNRYVGGLDVGDGALVWSENDGQDHEIFAHDLSTELTVQLTNNDYGDRWPMIDGDNVVWSGDSLIGREIFHYNLSTGDTTQITNDDYSDSQYQIDGNYIVWQGGASRQIFAYNIAAGATTQLTDSNVHQHDPQVSDTKVVWTNVEGYYENVEIFMATLESAIPTEVDIGLGSLNLKSKGRYITAYLELPEGYDAADIDIATVSLNDVPRAESSPTELGDNDKDGIADLMVKFDRETIYATVEPGLAETLTIFFQLQDGTMFQGSDTIEVMDQGQAHIDNGNPASIEK